MSGAGGFTVSRNHGGGGGDRFYNPPARRQRQQQLLQQQHQEENQRQKQQLRNRIESDDSKAALLKQQALPQALPNVRSSTSGGSELSVTNLDRLVESVAPSVPAHYLSQVNVKRWRPRESELHPFYCLGDLWESFREWSAYGVGVPLLLNGKDSIIQYYVPFLSGMQLYKDPQKPPQRLRQPGDESEAESSRETSSCGSSDHEASRRSKIVSDGSRSQQNLGNSNAQRLDRLSLRDNSVAGSSSDEAEISHTPGLLMFEYLEQEQPYNRKPLTDKVSFLASQFPELLTCRSCDLLPSSWISVAWYPIYRIPMGPTLKDLDASFLTFHSLSTHSRSSGQHRIQGASSRKVNGVDVPSNVSLPVFGLASYKLKGSILSPGGPFESEQENSLLQAADNWLRRLKVYLPDYHFFRSHYSQWR